uniref:Xylose isomerase-like TIM barrel domain-containing protein n=1 Tax=Schlesneria paludicola TaxID=360056 RepID=A0A7C2NZD6_9PLAN
MLSRRDFLAATAAALTVRPALAATPLAATPSSPLLLAAETGLLERSAGCDVVAQIDRAAELGFRAFSDPSWTSRTLDEQHRILQGIRRQDMTPGPMVGPSGLLQDSRRWATCDGIDCAIRVPLGPAALHCKTHTQLAKLWAMAADTADASRRTLLVEPWDDARLGTAAFLRSAEIVRQVDHPRLRLSVDAHQLWRAGILLSDFGHRHCDIIGHVELPAMTSAFRTDAVVGLRALWRSGFRGVIGLRQGLAGHIATAEVQLAALRQRLEHDVTGEHTLTMDSL